MDKLTCKPVPYEFKHGDKCVIDLPEGASSPVLTFCCSVPGNSDEAVVMIDNNSYSTETVPLSHLKPWSDDDE